MTKRVYLERTAGEMTLDVEGDGNNTKQVIEVSGAQFPFTEFIKTDSGFQLVIYGEWELEDFKEALYDIGNAL